MDMREITPQSSPPKGISFVQWDKKTVKPYRELIHKSPTAAEILSLFIEHMDRSNTIVVSNKTLVEIIGKTRQTISTGLKVLVDEKWVQLIKVGNAGAYRINTLAFWQGYSKDKQYAKFDAVVIASGNEQELETIEMKEGELKVVPIVFDNELLIESE